MLQKIFIKAIKVEKIVNAIKEAAGLVSYLGLASPCSSQIAKNLSLYHLTVR